MSAKFKQNLVLFPAQKCFPHATVTVNYSSLAYAMLLLELSLTSVSTRLDLINFIY